MLRTFLTKIAVVHVWVAFGVMTLVAADVNNHCSHENKKAKALMC